MKRLFSRTFKPRSGLLSQEEASRTEAFGAKIVHNMEMSRYYETSQNVEDIPDIIKKMVNGNEVLFFKCNRMNKTHIETMITEFQRLRPKMAIDMDNHITDVMRGTHDRYE